MAKLRLTNRGIGVRVAHLGHGGGSHGRHEGAVRKLLSTDCEMVGNLAADKAKRDLFRTLAVDLRMMASDVEAALAGRNKPDQ